MEKEKFKKSVVGYTFVVCDLLHWGHIKFLEKCKKHCDYLVVGVYTDELTLTYKRRPIIPYEQRLEMVRALKVVDEVRKVEHIDATPILKQLVSEGYNVKVLMHAKQAEWKEIKGTKYIESIGGKLVQPEYTNGVSSTQIIETILKRVVENEIGSIKNIIVKPTSPISSLKQTTESEIVEGIRPTEVMKGMNKIKESDIIENLDLKDVKKEPQDES